MTAATTIARCCGTSKRSRRQPHGEAYTFNACDAEVSEIKEKAEKGLDGLTLNVDQAMLGDVSKKGRELTVNFDPDADEFMTDDEFRA